MRENESESESLTESKERELKILKNDNMLLQ